MMLEPLQVEHALLCKGADQRGHRLMQGEELVVPTIYGLSLVIIHAKRSVVLTCGHFTCSGVGHA